MSHQKVSLCSVKEMGYYYPTFSVETDLKALFTCLNWSSTFYEKHLGVIATAG